MEEIKINIKSNIDINMNSLEEFDRLLISSDKTSEYSVEISKTDSMIKVVMEYKGDKKEFIYRDYSSKIGEQILLMIKNLMIKMNNKNYKWGTLIGVRPTKLFRRLLHLGSDFQEIDKILEDVYLVAKEKRELLERIVKKELEYLNTDKINVYIGVPFCPTKCRYCSFASYEIGSKQGKNYDNFVETLLEEIKLSGEFLKENKYEIESLYIGGGTPTTLNEKDLESVLEAVRENFDLDRLREFTVEAGRIDTINSQKLQIMKKFGVHRISINPQTFNEEILKELNRYFDKEYFDKVYAEAREMNFVINMDLIIGLPNESTEDILRTLDTVKNYDIENLTIHVLALKKGSNLYREGHIHEEIDYEKIEKKITSITESKELKPYYMYRQKNSLEWGENIGYSVEGKESIFNIQIIEESQSTFGLGGGAITKFTNGAFDEEIELERIVNPKEPLAYIKEMRDRFDKKVKLFKK